MASFSFKLQAVLDYRQSLVDRTRLELAAIQSRLRQDEDQLQRMKASEQAALRRVLEAQQQRLDVPLVISLMEHLHELTARIGQQVAVVERRRKEVNDVQQRMLEQLKEAKGLEKLRERQVEAHGQELRRLERAESSELAALRHQRLRRAG